MDSVTPIPSMGNEHIDKQHAELDQLIAKLVQDIQQSNDCSETLSSLIQAMLDHFNDEMQFMDGFDYPFMETHSTAHTLLLAHVRALAVAATPNNVTAKKVETFVNRFKDHFENYDLLYKEYKEVVDKKIHGM